MSQMLFKVIRVQKFKSRCNFNIKIAAGCKMPVSVSLFPCVPFSNPAQASAQVDAIQRINYAKYTSEPLSCKILVE